MNGKTQGTIVLDGLIEGRLPNRPDGEQALREWLDEAAASSLRFSLQVEAGTFSLLADNRPVAAAELGREAADTISAALRALVRLFGPTEPGSLQSTLRSVEYRRGEAVQTLYTVRADGTVEVVARTVDAQTVAPPRPLTTAEKVRFAAAGLAAALAILLASSFVVDYERLLGKAVEAARPFRADELAVDAGPFERYVSIVSKARRGEDALALGLKRSGQFPLSSRDVDRLFAAAGGSVAARLTVEALARGYVRWEYFDGEGTFLGQAVGRIADLRRRESIVVVLALPREGRPVRLVMAY